jgi:hypothetical protein
VQEGRRRHDDGGVGGGNVGGGNVQNRKRTLYFCRSVERLDLDLPERFGMAATLQ